MTWNVEHERKEETVLRSPPHGNPIGAAVAVSVLVAATITLTLVAGGFGLVSTLFP